MPGYLKLYEKPQLNKVSYASSPNTYGYVEMYVNELQLCIIINPSKVVQENQSQKTLYWQ